MIATDPDRVISAALGWLGTPYRHQASARGAGADCLGLARGVWRELNGAEPEAPPPYTRDWGEAGARQVLADAARRWMIEIPVAEIQPGALVLFQMRPGAPAKHCGIYIGGRASASARDEFIHAYERHGVCLFPFSPSWRRRVRFAFLFPESRLWLR